MPDLAVPRRRSRRGLVGGVVVLAVGVVAGTAYAATTTGPGTLRTALAGPADVASTLSLVGTVSPETKATLTFPSAGIVTAVTVTPGTAVSAGQLLATVDSTDLRLALTSATAALAAAQNTLTLARDGQLPSTGARSASVTVPAAAAVPSASAGSRTPSGAGSAAAQQSVSTGSRAVDAALARLRSDLASEQAACAPASPSPAPSATASPSPSASGTPSSAASVTPAPSPSRGGPSPGPGGAPSCGEALQRAGSDAEAVAAAEGAQAASLAAEQRALTSTSTTRTSAATATTATTATPASAAQLAAYQAQVDAAASQVSAAQQNLAAATLVAPIPGTVQSVTFLAGQSSAGRNLVITGVATAVVTAAVPAASAGLIRVGQDASVVADGSTTPLTATVTGLGAAPTAAGSYLLTLGLAGAPGVPLGASGVVTVDAGRASGVLSVPTSAVHPSLTGTTVEVVQADGSTRSVPVRIGLQSATLTQIVSGLHAGQRVVLADLSQPLPSQATTLTAVTTRSGRAGGFGGGGGFAGTRTGGGAAPAGFGG